MLTGHALDLYRRRIIEPAELSEWAEQLLLEGHESHAILVAVGNAEMNCDEVNRYFVAICRDLGLSENIDKDIDRVIRRVWLDEYRRGQRCGAHVLQKFDDIRRKIGYPEQIIFRILEDNPQGGNDSGFYGWETGLRGDELADSIRPYFAGSRILDEGEG